MRKVRSDMGAFGWSEKTYDKKDRLIRYETSTPYWEEWSYNSKGERVNFRSSEDVPVIISLGGGVQSIAMSLLSDLKIIRRADHIIFSDTGCEPNWVYEQIEWLRSMITIPIHIVKKDKGLMQGILDGIESGKRVSSLPYHTITEDNRKGIGMRQCTYDYKIAPIRRYVKSVLGYKKVIMMLGISTDEIMRMKPSNVKWVEHKFPLIEKRFDRRTLVAWVYNTYGKTIKKSSCIICPFTDKDLASTIRLQDPESYDKLVEFDKVIRTGTNYTASLYLNKDRVPVGQWSGESMECGGDCFL